MKYFSFNKPFNMIIFTVTLLSLGSTLSLFSFSNAQQAGRSSDSKPPSTMRKQKPRNKSSSGRSNKAAPVDWNSFSKNDWKNKIKNNSNSKKPKSDSDSDNTKSKSDRNPVPTPDSDYTSSQIAPDLYDRDRFINYPNLRPEDDEVSVYSTAVSATSQQLMSATETGAVESPGNSFNIVMETYISSPTKQAIVPTDNDSEDTGSEVNINPISDIDLDSKSSDSEDANDDIDDHINDLNLNLEESSDIGSRSGPGDARPPKVKPTPMKDGPSKGPGSKSKGNLNFKCPLSWHSTEEQEEIEKNREEKKEELLKKLLMKFSESTGNSDGESELLPLPSNYSSLTTTDDKIKALQDANKADRKKKMDEKKSTNESLAATKMKELEADPRFTTQLSTLTTFESLQKLTQASELLHLENESKHTEFVTNECKAKVPESLPVGFDNMSSDKTSQEYKDAIKSCHKALHKLKIKTYITEAQPSTGVSLPSNFDTLSEEDQAKTLYEVYHEVKKIEMEKEYAADLPSDYSNTNSDGATTSLKCEQYGILLSLKKEKKMKDREAKISELDTLYKDVEKPSWWTKTETGLSGSGKPGKLEARKSLWLLKHDKEVKRAEKKLSLEKEFTNNSDPELNLPSDYSTLTEKEQWHTLNELKGFQKMKELIVKYKASNQLPTSGYYDPKLTNTGKWLELIHLLTKDLKLKLEKKYAVPLSVKIYPGYNDLSEVEQWKWLLRLVESDLKDSSIALPSPEDWETNMTETEKDEWKQKNMPDYFDDLMLVESFGMIPGMKKRGKGSKGVKGDKMGDKAGLGNVKSGGASSGGRPGTGASTTSSSGNKNFLKKYRRIYQSFRIPMNQIKDPATMGSEELQALKNGIKKGIASTLTDVDEENVTVESVTLVSERLRSRKLSTGKKTLQADYSINIATSDDDSLVLSDEVLEANLSSSLSSSSFTQNLNSALQSSYSNAGLNDAPGTVIDNTNGGVQVLTLSMEELDTSDTDSDIMIVPNGGNDGVQNQIVGQGANSSSGNQDQNDTNLIHVSSAQNLGKNWNMMAVLLSMMITTWYLVL